MNPAPMRKHTCSSPETQGAASRWQWCCLHPAAEPHHTLTGKDLQQHRACLARMETAHENIKCQLNELTAWNTPLPGTSDLVVSPLKPQSTSPPGLSSLVCTLVSWTKIRKMHTFYFTFKLTSQAQLREAQAFRDKWKPGASTPGGLFAFLK